MKDYSLLTNEQDLQQFREENKQIDWLCIDTEFIGEKRYQTLLCLVQVATTNGLYIFDAIQLPHIQPIVEILANPNILKISHAGENDYRLMQELYQVIPKNVFDTQIAAGFVGHRYPISFRALVQAELNRRVSKVQTVTDWEHRPIKARQIQYALDDVIPLKALHDKLSSQIEKLNRTDWVKEEMQKVESAEYYEKIPFREALNHNLLPALARKEQVFLIRLIEWRRQLAERRNHSKEMVLAKKYIPPIVKSIHLGVEGLRQNRRISERFVKRYGKDMETLYKKDITAEEKDILRKVPTPTRIDPKKEIKMEMLYAFINYQCLSHKIAPELVFPRGLFKRMKENTSLTSDLLKAGWRNKILGTAIMKSLSQRDQLQIEIEEGQMVLRLR
ncbi:MAG: ribonuclease D [Bacteroidota bacterium]